MSRMLNQREAAERLGISSKMLDRYVADGKIEVLKYGDGYNARKRYEPEAIQAFIESSRVAPKQQEAAAKAQAVIRRGQ